MTKKSKVERATLKNTIRLEVGIKGGKIDLNDGPWPYLWIGSDTCFGCVPDRQIKKLRDFCNRILDKRKIKAMK